MQRSYYRFFDIRTQKGWVEVNFKNGFYNYITPEVLREMDELITDIDQNNNINCAFLISGVEGIFSRGLELKLFKSFEDPEKIKFISEAGNLLFKLHRSKIPFICAVNGECFGAGLELMLSCDIRIASHNSRFGAPEVIFGLIPSGGGIQRLLRLIGRGQASRLLFTGMTVDAKEALRIGLIEEAVDEGELYKRCTQIASRLSRIPRSGITGTKEKISNGTEHLLTDSITKDFSIYKENLKNIKVTQKV